MLTNNQNSNFENTVFCDETTMQTYRYGFYHMRRPSKRLHASSIKLRNVESLQIWGGISHEGRTEIVVNLFYLYNKIKKYY